MKTVEELLKYEFKCMDNRDKERIVDFCTVEQLKKIGVILIPAYEKEHKPITMTKELVLEQFKRDALLGQEKALNQRGVSSAMMYQVIRMWLWILEDPLYEVYNCDTYHNYGLELFERVIDKYVFDRGVTNETK